MEITFNDCVRELVTARAQRDALCAWDQRVEPAGQDARRLQAEFNATVRQLRHRELFGITPEQIDDTISRTSHALGDLEKSRHTLQAVDNFYTPFAIQYFFYDLIEQTGRVPLWENLWEAMISQHRDKYLEPLLSEVGTARPRLSRENVIDAFRWRIALAYYSGLREVYTIAHLRGRYGLEVKYHLIADLVLKVDGWCGKCLLALRVPNAWENRKRGPSSDGGFKVVTIAGDRPRENARGKLWLPRGLDAVAAEVRSWNRQ